MRGVSCSCPGALGPPGYYRVRGVNLRPQALDGCLVRCQILAPAVGLPGEAVDLEGEGDQRENRTAGGTSDDRQSVAKWSNMNLGELWGLLEFVMEAFWVLAFS